MPLDAERLMQARVRLRPSVAKREFPSESIVLNLDAGKYHGLNAVATSMVAALEESATVADAARAVATEYDQPLDRIVEDMRELIADLVERGLATVEYGS